MILEKETDVSEDPRGIALTGDAVRIGYQLGVGPALTSKIGHGARPETLLASILLTNQLRHWRCLFPSSKLSQSPVHEL